MREQPADDPVGGVVIRLEAEPAVDERVEEQDGDERRPAERAPHTFSAGREPRRPGGRKTSTRMRIEKTIALVQRAEMYWSLHADRNPMKNPPSAAPGMLPMPPSTAAGKARGAASCP